MTAADLLAGLNHTLDHLLELAALGRERLGGLPVDLGQLHTAHGPRLTCVQVTGAARRPRHQATASPMRWSRVMGRSRSLTPTAL